MKKLYFIFAVAFTTTFTFSVWNGGEKLLAQSVAINSNGALPNPCALLDINAAPGNNKGLLVPRISLLSTTDVVTIPSPATSLLVYNTNASMIGGALGFWYWDGTAWVAMGSGSSSSASGWLTTGNNGITAANFLGPINNAVLKFRTNNIQSGIIDPAGPTYLGFEAGLSSTGGPKNVGLGYQVMKTSITGNNNTAVGYQAMMTSNSQFNTAVGYYSLTGFTSPGLTGMENTAIGYGTLDWLSTGSYNCALGSEAGSGIRTGDRNIAIGKLALAANQSGSENIAIGDQAMGAFFSTGSFNVAIGKNALTGSGGNQSNNTCIGYMSDATSGSLNPISNATALGNGAIATANNTMMFGNTSVIGWGFGVTPSATQALKVGTGATNGNGASLTVGGTWTNSSSRSLKDNITQLDGTDILSKIGKLEVARWKYKGTEEYHIGPFAEQFYDLFNTGINNISVSTIDPSGVALVGVQQLIKENKNLKSEIEKQDARIKKLEDIISANAKK